MANYSRKKFPIRQYIRNRQTDRQTDRQMTTVP